MTALIWNIHLVMRYDSSRAIIKIQETNNGINAYSNKQSRNPLRSEYFRDSLPKLFSPVFLFKQNTSYKKHYVKYGNLLYRSIELCFRISMNFLEFGWNRGIGYLYYNKYDQTSEWSDAQKCPMSLLQAEMIQPPPAIRPGKYCQSLSFL